MTPADALAFLRQICDQISAPKVPVHNQIDECFAVLVAALADRAGERGDLDGRALGFGSDS